MNSGTKKTIAIVGHGYVGKAVEAFFKDKYNIVIYDPADNKTDKEAVNASDAALVCVPTPMSEDGKVDLSIVREIFSWLDAKLVVLKSTVPPGTTAMLIKEKGWEDKLVFSPEFIGEGNYPVPHWENMPHPTDMKLHHFHIFGGSLVARRKAIEIWKPITGPFIKLVQTDTTTAELTKYMENAWIASKITFCNEFFEIAKTFGVDYNELRELWLLDGRVGRSHTLVFEARRGFDGKCIPKDTNGIAKAVEAARYYPQYLKAILESNKRFRGGI